MVYFPSAEKLIEMGETPETLEKIVETLKFAERPKPQEEVEARKINIKAIAFGGKKTKITKTENGLYGEDKGSFAVSEGEGASLYNDSCDLLKPIIQSSFLGDAWNGCELRSLTIESYNEELDVATISAQLTLEVSDGDKYRILSITSGGIGFATTDIKPIIDEAIALILSKPKYEQGNLLGDEND
jgi:hypothetical protein